MDADLELSTSVEIGREGKPCIASCRTSEDSLNNEEYRPNLFFLRYSFPNLKFVVKLDESVAFPYTPV